MNVEKRLEVIKKRLQGISKQEDAIVAAIEELKDGANIEYIDIENVAVTYFDEANGDFEAEADVIVGVGIGSSVVVCEGRVAISGRYNFDTGEVIIERTEGI